MRDEVCRGKSAIPKSTRRERAALALKIWDERIGHDAVTTARARDMGVPLPRGTVAYMKNAGLILKQKNNKYILTQRGANLGYNLIVFGKDVSIAPLVA